VDNLDKLCRPFPGAQQTVRDLKDMGYFLALTTANSTAVAEQLLQVLGISEYFDAVCGREICEDPITRVKDYSGVPEQISKTIDECIVIEDSPVGILGAIRAGFLCVAFEHFKDESIQKADYIVHNFNDLRKIFGLPKIDLI
jgi:pyrophosphatase PpaX